VLFALDHHRGSEEQQPGQPYHDPALLGDDGQLDSFNVFRRNIALARLENTVIPVVAPSQVVARQWTMPLALLFIDGGHSMEAALGDYRSWAGHLMPGGILAIHDVFFDPAEGGAPPHRIWRLARQSGLFEEVAMVHTLGLLRRLGHDGPGEQP